DAEIRGGYSYYRSSEMTLFALDPEEFSPAPPWNDPALPDWKDRARSVIASSVERFIRHILVTSNIPGQRIFEEDAAGQIAGTVQELVLNSWLWGGVPAFCGLQRSSSRVTVCVADAGIGFLSSMQMQAKLLDKLEYRQISTELDAIRMGCLINNDRFALRGAVNAIHRCPEAWRGRIRIF